MTYALSNRWGKSLAGSNGPRRGWPPTSGLSRWRRPVRRRSKVSAHLSLKASQYKESIEFWKKAIAVNPWRSDYHAELADAALHLRDWRTAAQACKEALRLNPTLVQVRKWLVTCELRLGNREHARDELETLLRFDPPDRDELLRRFSVLPMPR